MKKIYLPLLLFFVLTLSACATGSSGAPVNAEGSSNELAIETQLVVGTLKLEDTAQAITSDQATELLVLWQVYENLYGESATAQAEIDGLIDQIQETMTTDQLVAISTMNLTQQDVMALMQSEEIAVGQTQQNSSSAQSSANFSPPDGGMGGGGAPPDGGMGGGGDMGGMMDTGGTGDVPSEAAAPTGGGGGMNTFALVQALIAYLEQLIAA